MDIPSFFPSENYFNLTEIMCKGDVELYAETNSLLGHLFMECFSNHCNRFCIFCLYYCLTKSFREMRKKNSNEN